MSRTRPRAELPAIPNPVMDVVLTAVCMMLLVFSLKVIPTAPAATTTLDVAEHARREIGRDAGDRAEAVRLKYADRLLALPPLGGWVALTVDISPSITIDRLQSAEASVVAALVLNHKDITHLRVSIFGGRVFEVNGWVPLDAPNDLSADKQDEIAAWLQAKLGASEAAAAELSRGQRPLVLAELLVRMGDRSLGTNLVAAIADAVTVAGGRAPATAIIVTDGVHTGSGDDVDVHAPDDIAGVRTKLDAALAKLPGRGDRPPPAVHAIALLGEPAWTGKRKGEEGKEPPAEDIVGMLRALTGRFGGTVLALPCEPRDWTGADGLRELMTGKSPVPTRAKPGRGAKSAPATGSPSQPGSPSQAESFKKLFYGIE